MDIDRHVLLARDAGPFDMGDTKVHTLLTILV